MSKKSLRWRGEDDNIDNILKFIETSYDLEFSRYDFKDVETFGELCDKILSKIKLQDTDGDTNRQAFLKLKESIEKIRSVEKLQIDSNTELTEIFPRKNRRGEILEIEKMLGVKLKAFQPTRFASATNLIFVLIAGFLFFIDWKFGLAGLILLVTSSWTIEKTTKHFKDKTFGELAERMTLYNYVKSRQNPTTVNRKEIEDKIKKLFIENWGLKEGDIERGTLI
jgi:hypothetical protein